MNIFLPYENDAEKNVQSLDDLRLNKQILECYQLLSNAIKEKNGEEIKGYKNHPIYIHYKDNVDFLGVYGLVCCVEYRIRFQKIHKLSDFFFSFMYGKKAPIEYTPFYMEGSKGQPNYIRTTLDVEILFQSKLILKWEQDKRKPKWTKRKIPMFYQEYIELSQDDKNIYWEKILDIKRKHNERN